MAFLPIVERELRLASSRKSNYRIRLWTTLAAVFVSIFFMLIGQLDRAFLPNLGRVLFSLLSSYAFGLSLIAGVFFAGDIISKEKREGTLGLLFLTDLKAYDIVLGKLVAAGLSPFYSILAVLPVMSLSLLLGGVTSGEYWRVSQALVNTLFFALSTGMLVSTCSRQATRARTNTLGVLIVATVGLPMVGGIISLTHLSPSWWYLTSVSPFYPFRYSGDAFFRSPSAHYWIALLNSHLFAWAMLFLASWLLPRVWQDKPIQQKSVSFVARRQKGLNEKKANLFPVRRARLLDQNPILWLAAHRSGMSWWVWAIPLLELSLLGSILWIGGDIGTLMVASSVFWVLAFLLKAFMAYEACRFFVDARQSGALELILSTPTTNREIIRGQWLALKRVFLWPVILFLALYLSLSILQLIHSPGYSRPPNIRFNGAVVNFFQSQSWTLVLIQIGGFVYQIGKTVADLIAVGWVGIWLSALVKRPNFAVPLTVLFAVILPAMFVCAPNLLLDAGLIFWARQKLLDDFRRTVLPEYSDPFNRVSLVPVPNIPPIIRR